MMNAGASLDDIVHTVRAPHTYWSGPTSGRSTTSPSSSCATSGASTAAGGTATRRHLKPASCVRLRRRDGRAGRRRRRRRGAGARRWPSRGDDESLRLAGQLAQLAVDADPSSKAAHGARAEVFTAAVAAEASTMSKGVFSYAATSPNAAARSCSERGGGRGPFTDAAGMVWPRNEFASTATTPTSGIGRWHRAPLGE